LALDSDFPVSPALTDISLFQSAGGDGRASHLSISAAGSCHPAVHQKITAHTYTGFPQEHWRRIRTNNAIERINREIRRRTRVVGTFPDGRSALMLVTARLKYVAESEWGSRRCLGVSLLDE
jgi:hypothetical protein